MRAVLLVAQPSTQCDGISPCVILHVLPVLSFPLHAQSKQKIIDKMVAKGLTEPVTQESTFKFQFPDCDKLPPPVMPFVDVSFSYSGKKEDYLYRVRHTSEPLLSHMCVRGTARPCCASRLKLQ